jgi:hypothetical protein
MKKSPNASRSVRYAAEKASPEGLAFRAIETRDADEAELQMRTHLAQVAGLYARVTGGGTWAPM